MTISIAVLLGIIQGIFMFFPVSSTSHLVLTQHFLLKQGHELPPPESGEMILFDLIVHVGTLVSIAVVFRKSLTYYIYNAFRGFGDFYKGTADSNSLLYVRLTLLGILSVVVTALLGFPLKTVFESAFAHPFVMSITLFITGVLLWWTDILKARTAGLKDVNTRIAVIVGIAQGLSLLPGISRSGTTIAFALFAGMKRRWAAEYSFFIAFPAILGASLFQGIDVYREGGLLLLDPSVLITAFTVSAVVGVLSLKLVLRLLYRAKFRFFSYYVWALSAAILIGIYYGVL